MLRTCSNARFWEVLDAETDDARFADLARLVFDQAHLAEGGQLSDPGGFVQRLNRVLLG